MDSTRGWQMVKLSIVLLIVAFSAYLLLDVDTPEQEGGLSYQSNVDAVQNLEQQLADDVKKRMEAALAQ